jgi:hypothetical protein
VITASGIPRPHTGATGPRQQVELRLTLTVSAEAEAAGREVVRVIAAACAQPTTPRAVERVATLRFLFPEIAVKVPEFYGVTDQRRRDDGGAGLCRGRSGPPRALSAASA